MPGTAEDAEAIRSVIARVAQTADSAEDLADYLEHFAPDAGWSFGDAELTGHDALRSAAQARRDAGRAGPGTASRHLISTVAVSVDGDGAVATSYWQFFTSTTTSPVLDSMGAYRDTLTRVGGAWRITRRDITLG